VDQGRRSRASSPPARPAPPWPARTTMMARWRSVRSAGWPTLTCANGQFAGLAPASAQTATRRSPPGQPTSRPGT